MQDAAAALKPDVVFVLGDVFDEVQVSSTTHAPQKLYFSMSPSDRFQVSLFEPSIKAFKRPYRLVARVCLQVL